jgi:dTDP-4-amino-4,6-dideoxygalactose transaminase
MIATGEGGMILTHSRHLADRLRDMRDYDKKARYRFRTNSKMTDLEASIGIEQLKKLPEFIRARRQIAERYHAAFRNLRIKLPPESKGRDHVYFRFVIRLPRAADKWIQGLASQGIEAKLPIYKPLHRYLKLSDRNFPETVSAMKAACSLPIFPSMDRESLFRICNSVKTQAQTFEEQFEPHYAQVL